MSKPWLIDGAIVRITEYLNNILEPKILEFGMGASTIWFVKTFDCELTSVEHDAAWYKKVKKKLDDESVNLILAESRVYKNTDLLNKPYGYVADDFPDEYFDLILIDGRSRVDCFNHAERTLKKGGMLVLDNSERTEYGEIMDCYKEKNPEHYTQKTGYSGWQTTIWIK